MDHLKMVATSEHHNGLTSARLMTIFGCLIFCSCELPADGYQLKETINPVDADQAARTFSMLFDIWPARVSKLACFFSFSFFSSYFSVLHAIK